MGTQKTTVVVNVEGEQQAAAAARRLEAAADRVKAKAEHAKREVREAELQGRKASLYRRALQKGALAARFSPVGIGAGGLSIRRPAVAGAIGLFVGDRLAEGATNMLMEWEAGIELEKIVRREMRDLLANWPGLKMSKLGYVLANIKAGGKGAAQSAAVFDTALNIGLSGWVGITPDIDEEIAGIASAQRARWAHMRAIEDAEREQQDKANAAKAAVFEKMDNALAEQLRGIKVGALPIRVPQAIFQGIRNQKSEIAALKNEIAKKRLAQGAGS